MPALPITPRLALMLSVPPLLWAGNAVVGRLAIGSIGPLWLNAARWSIALLLLLPLGWHAFGSAKRRHEIAQRWPHLALLSLTGVGAYNALQYMALKTSTPLNVTLIAASSPVWMLAIGAAVFGERPRPAQVLGALLSLAGVAVVLSRGSLATLLQVHLVPGDLLMLLAILSWCAYSWMLARPPATMRGSQRPDWHWAEFLCLQIALGLVWATAAAGIGEWLQPPARRRCGHPGWWRRCCTCRSSRPSWLTGCGAWAWQRPGRRWPPSSATSRPCLRQFCPGHCWASGPKPSTGWPLP